MLDQNQHTMQEIATALGVGRSTLYHRLEHGAPWFGIVWQPGQPPPPNVKLTGDLSVGIAFGEIGLDASDFPKIAKAVLSIVQAFMADFPETEFVDIP